MEPFHREQMCEVGAILTEALNALLRFENQHDPFGVVVAGWTEVRERLAFFELLSPHAVLQGLIDRNPQAPQRSLAARLWDLRWELTACGPGRAGTWQEFKDSDARQTLRRDVAKLVNFLISWRMFFDRIGTALTPNVSPMSFLRQVAELLDHLLMSPEAEPSVPAPVTLDQTSAIVLISPHSMTPPSVEPDGPYDTRRGGERVFGLRINGIETEFASDEEAVFKAISVMWPPDVASDRRPLEGEGGFIEAMGSAPSNARWAYNLALGSRTPCQRAGLGCHLKTDGSTRPTAIWWVHFGNASGSEVAES